MKYPDFSFENSVINEGYIPLGIDEVGRGAFAGPVGVGGVVFDPNLTSKQKRDIESLGINDSKKLTAKKRGYLSEIIKKAALAYHVCFIDVETINEIGVGKATFLGMNEVVQQINLKLKTENLYALVDAFRIPDVSFSQKGIIHGDSLSISIAAASIIAKVERDRIMKEMKALYPEYGFERHKGYGTKIHRENIYKFGLSPQHRTVFCEKTINHINV